MTAINNYMVDSGEQVSIMFLQLTFAGGAAHLVRMQGIASDSRNY
jgi:hypothetical protein